MFPVHCNKCGRRRSTESQTVFEITNCQHVLCSVCINMSLRKCPICNCKLQSIKITPNMPHSVAQYFEDPLPFLQMYWTVSKFQSDQNMSDNIHFWMQGQTLEPMKERLESYRKLDAQFRQNILKLKNDNAKMQAYITYHDNLLNGAGTSCSSPHQRPKTPSISSSDVSSLEDESTFEQAADTFILNFEESISRRKSCNDAEDLANKSIKPILKPRRKSTNDVQESNRRVTFNNKIVHLKPTGIAKPKLFKRRIKLSKKYVGKVPQKSLPLRRFSTNDLEDFEL